METDLTQQELDMPEQDQTNQPSSGELPVSPAVTFPEPGDNAYILKTKHGPVLIFSRRDLRQAIADALTDARRSSYTKR